MTSFSGGARLQARLKEMSKKLESAATLRAGFLEGATYPDGTSVPMVAAIQEWGAPAVSIPPRPYFRPTIAAHSDEWGAIIAAHLPNDDYDPAKTLGTVGEVIRGEIQGAISEVQSPALSPITLMLRKMFGNDHSEIRGADVGEAARRVAEGESTAGVNSKPLDWTGFMKSRVDYEVQTS